MNSIKFSLIIILLVVLAWGCGNKIDQYDYTGILEGTSIKVPALTGGKIVGFQVKEGESINKGQTLAIIDSLELSYQKQQLVATLNEIDVQSKIANTNLNRAEDDLVYIKEKYNRVKNLYENKSATRQSLDDAENSLKNVQSVLITARQNLQTLAAKKQQIKAQIKILRKKLGDCHITAPISGILTTKYYEVGEAVPPMSALLEIISIAEMESKIYVSETMLAKIRYNQEVKVSVDGLDEQLTGRIKWISPKAEFTPKTIMTPETRTSLVYAVSIVIKNNGGVLKHGMPVVVGLKIGDE